MRIRHRIASWLLGEHDPQAAQPDAAVFQVMTVRTDVGILKGVYVDAAALADAIHGYADECGKTCGWAALAIRRWEDTLRAAIGRAEAAA